MKVDVKAIQKKIKPRDSGRGSVTVYLNKALFKRLQDVADRQGATASQLIEEMISQYVKAVR